MGKVLGWLTLAGLAVIVVAIIARAMEVAYPIPFTLLCVGAVSFVLAGIPWAHTRGKGRRKAAFLGLIGFVGGGAAGLFLGDAAAPTGDANLGTGIFLLLAGFWLGAILFCSMGVWWGIRFHGLFLPSFSNLGPYASFTDPARKVMTLANQEAQRLNHEYIGTEHILLGLVKEGSGVAATVLRNREIDLQKIRREIEKAIPPGPDMVTMGKLPQTPRAKKVIEFALEEARNLNHNYVGTEHILLGLLREQDCVGCQVLTNMGLKLDDAQADILNLLRQPPG
ncbi:MAG TPA: Clp protease N-terminal domain-containing protein [Gemmataceae bacterium]|nr:Clp protease N-terminal domain-containing protein [Gemmataceae bacterium]